MLTRDDVVAALRRELEPLPWVHALWEAGSASFGRLDDLSDVDLQLDVDAGHVERAIEHVTACLAHLSPVAARHDLPPPTWHGHAQVFLRLQDAPETLVVDLVVMEHGRGPRFLERERHGQAVVYFDKSDVVRPEPVDPEAWRQRLAARLRELRTAFDVFSHLPLKALRRGHDLEALGYYQGMVLRPLVELLRIRHDPYRHDFGLRHVQHDLPPDVLADLTELHHVAGPGALEPACRRAVELFDRAWAELQAKPPIG